MTDIPPEIESPYVINILRTIRAIQTRMKDPDLINAEYSVVYGTLGIEFSNFFDTQATIFSKIIRGESFPTIAATLFYKDKISRGLMTESELSEKLATKYLPDNLKKEADEKIKQMGNK